ncbi:MAG: hypothetical protein GAK43_01428 [Stenotrophomonas maltophilia]|nr:MAG: hypothetical protein GAK43_01428 [Stenotrophomonas maltophilia]
MHAMSVELIDNPADMRATGSRAGTFCAALREQGTPQHIANATSRMALLCHAGHALPVSVDDGGYGRSYVASPHSAYVPYARREMELVGLRRGRLAAQCALTLLDGVLRAARINQVVHLDNWLLSTNLHGSWRGEGLGEMRRALCERHPQHMLILRSLDAWSSPQLLQAAREDGWILVPARQIWVVDDLTRQWRSRNNCGNDRRALARSALRVEDATHLSASDCQRIAQLYALLYLDKYCGLNPQFTADFIAMTHASGLIDYRVARTAEGQIVAVAGMLVRDGIMTPCVVGYDTQLPRSEALYRIASYLFCDWAEARGLKLHGSAGAAHFKRQRGAEGVIEYAAIHVAHLSPWRRAVIQGIAAILERAVVPMMQREGW